MSIGQFFDINMVKWLHSVVAVESELQWLSIIIQLYRSFPQQLKNLSGKRSCNQEKGRWEPFSFHGCYLKLSKSKAVGQTD